MLKHYGWTRDTAAERQMAKAMPEVAEQSPVLQVWHQGGFTAIVGHERTGSRVDDELGGLRWHLSVSHPSRYVTWDELKAARYGLIPDGVWMVQVLPPKDRYVSLHRNAFHLWEVPAWTVPDEVPA